MMKPAERSHGPQRVLDDIANFSNLYCITISMNLIIEVAGCIRYYLSNTQVHGLHQAGDSSCSPTAMRAKFMADI